MKIVCSARKIPLKGGNAIDSLASPVVGVISPGTRDIDPARSIEPMRSAVCKIFFCIPFCESSHKTLGRVADDQERMVISIDKIAVISAEFEWVDGTIAGRSMHLASGLRRLRSHGNEV